MVTTRTFTYECEACGTRLVVTESGKGYLSPIYCCGGAVKEVAMHVKSTVPRKKVKKKRGASKKKSERNRSKR